MVIPFLYPISVESPPPLTPLPLPDLVPRQQQQRDDGRAGRETAEEGEEEAIMPALRNGHDTAAKVIKLLTVLKSKQGTKMLTMSTRRPSRGRRRLRGRWPAARRRRPNSRRLSRR